MRTQIRWNTNSGDIRFRQPTPEDVREIMCTIQREMDGLGESVRHRVRWTDTHVFVRSTRFWLSGTSKRRFRFPRATSLDIVRDAVRKADTHPLFQQ